MKEKPLNSSPLKGKRIAFFGKFNFFPTYHLATPAQVAQRLGAIIMETVSEDLDFLVIADGRGTGRAEARKKGERLQKKRQKMLGELADGQPLQIIGESEYRILVRHDVTGKSFAFCGGFDCCPGELHDVLEGMATAVGATATEKIDACLDYLVVGNRRGKGKAAAIKAGEKLVAAGSGLEIISERTFREFARAEGDHVQQNAPGGEMPFPEFLLHVYQASNEKKVQRALKMLQKERFELYSEIAKDRVVGVVLSQTVEGTVYAPWLEDSGRYGCSNSYLDECMGLQGSICKHLLVLLLGLVHSRELDATEMLHWLAAAKRKQPKKGGDFVVEAILQYRAAQAGEVDWRPTETVPEDYYSL